ncbi:hypothetical protein BDP27DRAFT_15384 [Rhodocollybia butyracea]|uniref:Arf-GAP domain-containing protein n=1 Tax=Rhodocollybia butyracea TaxID=206335 RepID=A0A9P5QAN0_9AGAR|nr:hypothetical protein BDP27DRAFT_15384 [Rhodocollybia butyracea]
MSTNKITNERNQKMLLDLATQPGNDVCADCKARVPRWASHNLGIFICVNCASIHRKIGTHITKVKSLTMDSWTREQVERMKEMGNHNSNAIYNPNELRHPPPPMLTEDERDSELEKYIRAKYEYKKFFDRSALVASKLGPSRSTASITPSSKISERSPTIPTPPVSARPSTAALPPSRSMPMTQPRSVSQPVPSLLPSTQSQATFPSAQSQARFPSAQYQATSQQSPPQPKPQSSQLLSSGTGPGVWDDLVSLQAPSASSSLPLQYTSPSSAGLAPTNPYSSMTGINGSGMSANGIGYNMTSMGMRPGPNGLSINPGPDMGMNFGMNSTFSAGMSSATNPFQQPQFSAGMNPFAQHQQPMSAAFPSSSMPFSAVPTGLSTPFMAQQSPYQSQASPMIPQMQMQMQSPTPMYSPAPQNPMQQQQQFGGMQQGGHSLQPMMSTTPRLPMSATPQMQGQQFMSSPSPQLQTGMGMGMNGQTMQQTQMLSAGWGQQPQPAMYGQNHQWGGM